MTDGGHSSAHALDWVRGDLDETLKQATQSLEFFVENTGDEYELTACAEALQQVIGTLRLVELDGGVRYAEGLLTLLDAVREDRVERSEAIFEALMRGLLQLPAYLEYIQSGGEDLPQALLPELNELRALCGEAPLGPESFFAIALDAAPPAPAQPAPAALPLLAAKARPTYEKALVAWLRNRRDPKAMHVLQRVCELVVQAAADHPAVSRLWWTAGGLFEGLGAGAIAADVGAKQLLTALDRELKAYAADGPSAEAAEGLTRRILYRVAQATDAGPRSRELDAAFSLAGTVPDAELVEEVARRLHGPDTAVLRSVAEAVKEDFNRARDLIEIFGASSESEPADLAPLRDNLGRMADTLGMMGLNGLADAVREQRRAVEGMVGGSLDTDQPRVVDVAEVLLHVDTYLQELADESGRALRVTDVIAPVPEIGTNRSGIAQPRLTALESRQVARAFYRVGLQELEQVREALVGDGEAQAPLADQAPRLIDLAGGLHMLGHAQAALLAGQLAGVVEQAAHEPLHGAQLEALADALTALESILVGHQADQATGRYLEVAEERVASLVGAPTPAAEGPGDDAGLDFDLATDLAASDPTPIDVGLDAEEAEGVFAEPVVEAPQVAADQEAVAEGIAEEAVEAPVGEAGEAAAPAADELPYPVLSASYDAETLDIFLEEADEVVGQLREQVPRWIANPSDVEVLGDIRRAFHTLKGSGRLVGAVLIGEFAWGYEDLLNRVIEGTRSSGPELHGTLERVVAVLPGLVEQLRGGPSPGGEVAALMAAASALAEGRPVPAAPAPEEVPVAEAGGAVEDASAETSAEPEAATQAEAVEFAPAQAPWSEGTEAVGTPQGEMPAGPAQGDTEAVEREPVPRIDPQLLAIYRREADAHLELLDSFVARARAGGDGAVPPEAAVRALHTLRGSSGMAEARPIAALAGQFEEYCKPRLAAGLALEPLAVEQLARACGLIRDMLVALGDRDLPFPAGDDVLAWLATAMAPAAELPGEAPVETASTNDLLMHGADLIDLLDDGVSRWVTASADSEPLRQLASEAEEVAQQAAVAGQPAIADVCHLLHAFAELMAAGRYGPEGEILTLLSDTASGLTAMFDSLAVSRPIEPDPALVNGLRARIDQAAGDVAGMTAAGEEPADATAPPPTAPPREGIWTPAEAVDPDLLEIFMEEGSELLDQAEATVHRWQANVGDREAIALLQRQLHTLKGGARMAGIIPMGDLSHASESLLTGVVEGRLEPDDTLFEVLNESVDALAQMLDAVRQDRPLTDARALRDALVAFAEGGEPARAPRFGVEPLPEVELPPAVPPPKTWGEAHPADQAASEAPVAARQAPVQQQEQVRVPAQLLNTLVNLAGEVSIYRSRLEQQNSVLRFNLGEFEQTVERLREQLRRLEIETDAQIMSRLETEGRTIEDFDPLEMDQYTALQTTSRALLESLNDLTNVREYLGDLTRESDTLLLQQSRVNTELQQGLMQARMMPFSRLVPRMRRIVRQTGQEMGKRVELWVQGEQSEVDSAVVDRIVAPLEHLIRNAIAHGIEAPEERRAAGKDPIGKLTLTVDREGSDVVFRVKDDGAGIDVDRVRQKAIEQGLLAPEAEISEHDILQFIFESGMSTAKQVTQISGRGVGMDVVISEVRQLGGSVEINSKRGFGASFYLRIPFTLAVNRALLVEVGDELYAIPLTSIEGIVRMRAEELQAFYADERETYDHAGIAYQVRHLGRLLGTSEPVIEAGQERIPVLLVHSGDQGIALHVDGLVGSREIVVKSVGPQLSGVRGLFGATILVDGRVALILDTNGLAVMGAQKQAAQVRAAAAAVEERPQQTTVMIVDDSITVRRVTTRLLERNAFRVITAKDGVDALQVLQDERPDIMLLDIEMPRMDGFELAQHIRGDAQLHDLPIIMITSRTGEKHRQRGLEIGVDRFLGKPYQDADLLENIRELTAAREATHG